MSLVDLFIVWCALSCLAGPALGRFIHAGSR